MGSRDSLVDRIVGRRAGLVEQAERLRKELAEVEAELARMVTAEQVVAQLLAEADHDVSQEAGHAPDPAPSSSPSGGRAGQGLAVPHRPDGVAAADLPGDYRLLLQIVAEEGPVGCKRVCAKLGLTGEPRHTEGVRVKLKRLVERGWLIESAPGQFSPRS